MKDDIGITHHISQQFNAELEDMRNRVLAMGGLVEAQIARALQALAEGDSEQAQRVVATDMEVNSMEVAVDEECARVLARRQPAASDLRLVMAVIKTITDLERIGDEAEKIGRMAANLAQEGGAGANSYSPLLSLGEVVRKNLRDALDAFARMDSEAALQVAKEDERVDREYEAILRQLITYMMEDPRTISRCLDVMWAARALERIGDHTRNICEYVIYLVQGKDVRHTSLDQLEEVVHTTE